MPCKICTWIMTDPRGYTFIRKLNTVDTEKSCQGLTVLNGVLIPTLRHETGRFSTKHNSSYILCIMHLAFNSLLWHNIFIQIHICTFFFRSKGASRSRSKSGSRSKSRSRSKSGSRSKSRSRSKSGSPSKNKSRSKSGSRSKSRSRSKSGSRSRSGSRDSKGSGGSRPDTPISRKSVSASEDEGKN